MNAKALRFGALAAVTCALAIPATAQTVPPTFKVRLLATDLDQPKGLDSALHRAGAGQMGDPLFVAESGANRILEMNRTTGQYTVATTTAGFPVGVACYGGPFAQYMYVGNAFAGGIQRCTSEGIITPFALSGMSIAGLDFGKGQFGQYLYAGEWQAGRIWRVDPAGNASVFATIPGTETRYLELSKGGQFGHYLYFTDYVSGNIYRVDPNGTSTLFTNVTTPFGLEGLTFGPGGVFGDDLYAGNLSKGEIYQVDASGTVTLWASGFRGVADIHFIPGGAGGFTMYVVDGVSSVYAIGQQRNHKL